jgi:hypothetical protein
MNKYENLCVKEETTIEKVKDEDIKVTTYKVTLEHVPVKGSEETKFPKITITSDEPIDLKHGMKGITITVSSPQKTLTGK